MVGKKAAAADYSWERELAPRVSNSYWYAVVALFAAWVLFLTAMAVHRWVYTLQ